jgi:hypothetical protein
MPRRLGAGGFISSRMAERMAAIASSWFLSLPSSSLLASQSGVRGEEFLQLHESAHEVHAHGDNVRGAQDISGLDGAVFGEGERTISPAAQREIANSDLKFSIS